jgi:hypothetical protein
MPNTATLKVNCAIASESPNAALTAGIAGKNRWMASGPMNVIIPSAKPNQGPGILVISEVLPDGP